MPICPTCHIATARKENRNVCYYCKENVSDLPTRVLVYDNNQTLPGIAQFGSKEEDAITTTKDEAGCDKESKRCSPVVRRR